MGRPSTAGSWKSDVAPREAPGHSRLVRGQEALYEPSSSVPPSFVRLNLNYSNQIVALVKHDTFFLTSFS